MNKEQEKDKELIRAQLAKQIKEAVEFDQNEDPAILSQTTTTRNAQNNPEQAASQETYKKKVV